MNEKWKPVVDFENLYLVSDSGRVRSLPRKTKTGVRGGKILKQNQRISKIVNRQTWRHI